MSWHHSSLVWQHSSHKGSALLILLAVSESMNSETGETWLSIDYLARKSRTSRRTVIDTLPLLSASNELTIHHGRGKNGTNVYRLGPFYQEARYCRPVEGGADFAPLPEPPLERLDVGGADSARVQSTAPDCTRICIVSPPPSPKESEGSIRSGTGADFAPPPAPPETWVDCPKGCGGRFLSSHLGTWVAEHCEAHRSLVAVPHKPVYLDELEAQDKRNGGKR